MQRQAKEIASLLKEARGQNAGWRRSRRGGDVLRAREAGMKLVDGQQVMLDAREIKNIDEIVLLNERRIVRPAIKRFFDVLQPYQGYRTCYYRTFNVGRAIPVQRVAYKKCREW
jgi:hypothetical protein